MTDELKAQLIAAGYTDAQIAKEAEYMARVTRENELIRADKAWNYGIHHATCY